MRHLSLNEGTELDGIIWVASDDVKDFIRSVEKEAYERGRQSILEHVEHEQQKFLDGFAHGDRCEKCGPTKKA